jgi:oligopeptide/dipeptide ABC transporter ATP-binding protein
VSTPPSPATSGGAPGVSHARGAHALLEIEDLQVGFDTEAGLLRAVDGVTLRILPGQTLGLVGESGCGKSVTASSILRLVPSPPGRILGGSVRFGDVDILRLPRERLTQIRGTEISMIFQDPMTSLNPVFTVERQMVEVLRLRFGMARGVARARAAEMLATVGIADPFARLGAYPHELSGGMKQRVMIAMALLCEPKLLIADEPTTALDVTIQAQILHLIRELQRTTGTSVLFITHDMGVVAEMCDQVAVMYAGRIVEQGDVFEIFEQSKHPYTQGLLSSIPRPGLPRKADLPTIEGVVPSLLNPPIGCRFAERCWKRRSVGASEQERCFADDPALRPRGNGRVACHYPVDGGEQ